LVGREGPSVSGGSPRTGGRRRQPMATHTPREPCGHHISLMSDIYSVSSFQQKFRANSDMDRRRRRGSLWHPSSCHLLCPSQITLLDRSLVEQAACLVLCLASETADSRHFFLVVSGRLRPEGLSINATRGGPCTMPCLT